MSKTSTKLVSIGLSITTMIWLGGATLPVTANAATAAELSAQIQQMLASIQLLQSQLQAVQGTATAGSSYAFTKDLTLGSKGADVTALQNVLISAGHLKIAAATAYFGPLTKAALAAWQAANNVTPSVGYFGPKTRAAIVATGGAGTVTTPGGITTPVVTVPAGTDLVVALASTNPPARTIGSGTSFNPVLKLAFTAGAKDVKITGIKVKKGGFLANTNITGVDVIDSAGVRHGNVISSINADNEALLTLTSVPIVVKAGTTEYATIRFNLASAAASGNVYFSVDAVSGITADTTLISGGFPLTGSVMTTVSGSTSVAAVTVEARAVNTIGANFNVDSANQQEIAKFRITETSSREAIYLSSFRVYNVGTAADSDFMDVQLVDQIGNVLATAQPLNKYVSFDLSASPYLIDKGLNKDFTIRAKIVNGASRTIQFVVYDDYDVVVTGKDTNASVLATAAGNETTFPVEGNTAAYNRATVGSGSLIFNKDATSASAAVTPGSTNVELAKFYVKAIGENMELRQMTFTIAEATASTDITGTMYVRVNGAVVYSAAATSTAQAVTLTSYPILVSGVTSYITVEASISSNATASDSYQVTGVDLTQVKRLITNDITDPLVGSASGNAIAVKASSLAVTTLSTPVANSVVAGTTQYELAQFQLNAQAGGEDVKISKIIVTDTLADATSTYAGVTNLQMYLAGQPLSTSASTVTNANTVTFTFVTPITVTRAAAVSLSLRGDIVSVASSTKHTFNIASSTTDITATGVSTGNTVAANQMSANGTGQQQTVASAGTLALTNVSGVGSSPSTNQLVAIGSTNGTYFAFKLSSQYEAQKISALKLTWTGTSILVNDVKNLQLFKNTETTAFATAVPYTCSANVCSYSFTWADNWGAGLVNPSSPMTIYVKADIGGQSQAKLGDNFVFSIASTSDITSKGAISGTAASSITGTPTVSGITYVSPFNVVVTGETPSSGSSVTQTVAAGTTIGRFKVQNFGSQKVTLTGFKFTDNGSNSMATGTYTLFASDENQSNYTATSTAASTATSSIINYGTNTTFGGANLTLNGGTYRYFTVQITTAPGIVAGNSFNLSVSALGDLKYSVDDADLNYDGNFDANPNSGTSTGLFVSGVPALGTIVKQ